MKQAGFTLIELVAVIVLLGILAVIALPRFLSLKRDAIEASMDGMNAAMRSAAQLAYAKAAIDGVASQASSSINLDGQIITLAYGYPDGTATGIAQLIHYNSSDWKSRASTFSGAWVYWHGIIEEDAGVAQCYLRYRQSTADGLLPIIDEQYSGCN